MLDKKRLKTWKDQYWNQIKRNIGLISIAEQDIIKQAKIVIFGVGGLGGPLVSQLVRSGCEILTVCDNDKFTISNINRQLCKIPNMGEYKVDFTEVFAKDINQNCQIEKVYQISQENISTILKDCKVAVLSLDDPVISILIARTCLKENVPLLESWGIPYLFAWYFTSNSVDYESCYGLGTNKFSIDKIGQSEELQTKIIRQMLAKLTKFPNIKQKYNRELGILEDLLSGKLKLISLAPIVRLTASYLAFEVIFSGILEIKPKILAPNIIGYDYFEMKPIKFILQ